MTMHKNDEAAPRLPGLEGVDVVKIDEVQQSQVVKEESTDHKLHAQIGRLMAEGYSRGDAEDIALLDQRRQARQHSLDDSSFPERVNQKEQKELAREIFYNKNQKIENPADFFELAFQLKELSGEHATPKYKILAVDSFIRIVNLQIKIKNIYRSIDKARLGNDMSSSEFDNFRRKQLEVIDRFKEETTAKYSRIFATKRLIRKGFLDQTEIETVQAKDIYTILFILQDRNDSKRLDKEKINEYKKRLNSFRATLG